MNFLDSEHQTRCLKFRIYKIQNQLFAAVPVEDWTVGLKTGTSIDVMRIFRPHLPNSEQSEHGIE